MTQNRLIVGLLLLAGTSLWAQEDFRFIYEEGEHYRVLSEVEQDVYVNGAYSHHATIYNRIAIAVTSVEDGSGYHDATFITSEQSDSGTQVLNWGQEYRSEFWRDELGYYDIDAAYFMPVVRDVPVFPGRPIEPGDRWSAQGSEVHDFRRSFGIPDAYNFPIPVSYSYEGNVERDGREFALIRISYNVFFRPNRFYPGALYPVRISGYSNQLLYWDIELGRPDAYEEEYAFVFQMSTGEEIQYEGTARASVIEATRMDRPEMVEEIREDLDELGMEDQEVVADDLGVTIRLDNILFPPDSPLLRASEQAKLDGIAEILLRYPDRDIRVTGHTALAGTEAGRLRLSEERAAAVAAYLIELGVREPGQIYRLGLGAAQPVAENSTEEGMRRNRRVEITILEN
jgi:outer membrane protein OmpA-like peptidoglycan-associated protein